MDMLPENSQNVPELNDSQRQNEEAPPTLCSRPESGGNQEMHETQDEHRPECGGESSGNWEESETQAEPKNDETGGNRNLLVVGLSGDVTEAMLGELFSPYGTVCRVKVMHDIHTGKPRGHGFVLYEQSASADTALQTLNGVSAFGRTIQVAYSHCQVSDQAVQPRRTIFVRNVPKETPLHVIHEYFTQFGQLQECTSHKDKARGSDGRSQVMRMVFVSRHDAQQVVEGMLGFTANPFAAYRTSGGKAPLLMAKYSESFTKEERRSYRQKIASAVGVAAVEPRPEKIRNTSMPPPPASQKPVIPMYQGGPPAYAHQAPPTAATVPLQFNKIPQNQFLTLQQLPSHAVSPFHHQPPTNTAQLVPIVQPNVAPLPVVYSVPPPGHTMMLAPPQQMPSQQVLLTPTAAPVVAQPVASSSTKVGPPVVNPPLPPPPPYAPPPVLHTASPNLDQLKHDSNGISTEP